MKLILSKIVLIALFFLSTNHTNASPLSTITINNTQFIIEIAKTAQQRKKGLMFRKQLPITHGMLFVFSKNRYIPIWMKNTYIPLDILWINKKLKITHIESHTTPLSKKIIYPQKKAKYILEINAGLCEKYNIKVGSRCKLSFQTNKTIKNIKTKKKRPKNHL